MNLSQVIEEKAAYEWAGISEVPVIICDLDDSQAIVTVVNSNRHREHIKPSEKAFAYRMKLEASKIELFTNESGEWRIKNSEKPLKVNSNKELARQVGKSRAQVERYIRLRNLIPKILDVVDEEKPSQRKKLKINANKLDPYFPSEYTTNQKVQLIEKLVKDWHKEQLVKQKSR